MDSKKINDWLQIVGLFGVIGSLVFVGVELKQSRLIAIADVYQQRSAIAVQLQTSVLSNELALLAFDKASAGDALSRLEERMLYFNNNPWMTYYENTHFQYQIGLLSEEQWLATRTGIRGWTRWHRSIEWWAESRGQWRESFAREVDQVIEEEAAKQ